MEKKLKEYKTKTLLINAFIDLLEEMDFYDIKVTHICEKAMVHKTTFYNHFEDKYDLLNYIIQKLHSEIKTQAVTDKGVIDYYLSIARLYIEKFKERPKLINTLTNISSDGVSSHILYETYTKDVEEKISETNIEIPVKYVANFYVSAVFSLLNEWFRSGMKEDEETIIKYIDFLIRSEK